MKVLGGLVAIASTATLLSSGTQPILAQSAGSSEGTRQESSHIHGIVEMNLAVEGSQLYIELISPAANIVGFEHAPSTDE